MSLAHVLPRLTPALLLIGTALYTPAADAGGLYSINGNISFAPSNINNGAAEAIQRDCDADDLFLLPETNPITVSEDYVVERPCGIVILGSITANAGSGANIVLRSGRHLYVAGAIVAGAAPQVAEAISSTERIVGKDAAASGSIEIRMDASLDKARDKRSDEPSVTLASTAVLKAANGVDGGDALISGWKGSGRPEAHGGKGGAGGSVLVVGAAVHMIAGSLLQPGRGGSGGAAVVPAGGSAAGGRGGDAGIVYVEGMDLAAFLPYNANSVGGKGGEGVSGPSPAGAECEDPPFPLFGCNGNAGDVTCTPGQPTEGIGEDGGFGVVKGGDGGTASAVGCPQPGVGEPGFDGQSQECFGAPPEECVGPTNGTPGGIGPYAPAAYAYGGKGGDGLLGAGVGGDVTYLESQKGGTGGAGGDGGGAIRLCKRGGDGGDGGKGGDGGGIYASMGDGGNALLGPGGAPGKPQALHPGEGGEGGAGGRGGGGGGDVTVSAPWIGGPSMTACYGPDGDDGMDGLKGDEGFVDIEGGKPGQSTCYFVGGCSSDPGLDEWSISLQTGPPGQRVLVMSRGGSIPVVASIPMGPGTVLLVSPNPEDALLSAATSCAHQAEGGDFSCSGALRTFTDGCLDDCGGRTTIRG